MIPQEQLDKRAQKLYDDIVSAKVYLNNQETNGDILKKVVVGNLVTVFVSLSSSSGTVNRVELYDTDGELVQFQEMNVAKDNRTGYVAIIKILVEGGTVNV